MSFFSRNHRVKIKGIYFQNYSVFILPQLAFKNLTLTLFGLFLCAISLLCAAPAKALSITEIRFGEQASQTRMVIELDSPSDFSAFMLNDPFRLVVDLPRYHWQAGTITKPKSGLIKDVRTGTLNPAMSRLVVDLSKPAGIISAFTLPPNDTSPNRLVIDFKPILASDIDVTLKKRFGKLTQSTADKLLVSGADSAPKIQKATKVNAPQTTHNLKLAAPTKTQQGQIPEPKHKPNFTALPKVIQSATPSAPVPKSPLRKPHIVIDAGHGGQDPGAIGLGNVYEKRITLAAAKELKRQLEDTGRYTVSLTRDNDRFIKLHERIKIARKKDADMFLSLHADSIADKNVRGFSIYTLSNKASDRQTAKLARRENRADLIAGVDLTHEDKEVSDILIDLAMRDTMNQSKFFANLVVDTLPQKGIKVLGRPHRYAGFAVLKAPDIPSVLVELGFMSNKEDVRLLNTSRYRKKLASALVYSINSYFDKTQ